MKTSVIKQFKLASLGALTAVALVATVVSIQVFAANSGVSETFQGLNMSPASNSIKLKNGEVYSGKLNVRNSSAEAMNINMSVESYSIQNNDYGSPAISDKTTRYSQMMNWIKLDRSSFSLAAGEATDVNYVIFTPNNPPAGSQYAVIKAAMAERDGEKTGIQTLGSLAFIIRADMVDGETVDKSSIIDEKIDGFQPESPLKASFKVKNEGNVGSSVKYAMRITNALGGKEVYKSDLQQKAIGVYPETTRSFTVKSDKLGIGFYNVELTVELNGKTETFKQFVVSVPIWIFILIGIAIICLVIYFVTRNQDNKKSSSKSKKTTRKSSKK